jgi:hypothetical protein
VTTTIFTSCPALTQSESVLEFKMPWNDTSAQHQDYTARWNTPLNNVVDLWARAVDHPVKVNA